MTKVAEIVLIDNEIEDDEDFPISLYPVPDRPLTEESGAMAEKDEGKVEVKDKVEYKDDGKVMITHEGMVYTLIEDSGAIAWTIPDGGTTNSFPFPLQ